MPYEYLNQSLEKLHRRFLKPPKYPVRITAEGKRRRTPPPDYPTPTPEQLLAENYLYRAYYQYERRNFAAAIDALNKSIQLNPQYVEALNNRGISRYQLKDYDGAIADLSEAIRLRPNDPFAYNNRAAALRMKGDLASFRQALADYETYLQLGGALQEQVKGTIPYMKLMLWLRSRVGR
jgi:tetratricopeptide (TPR) repeat protein